MDKSRWTNPKLPLEILALKLVEEVGEVAKEITDEYMIVGGEVDREMSRMFRKHAATELEHVEFLAKTLRKRIKALG